MTKHKEVTHSHAHKPVHSPVVNTEKPRVDMALILMQMYRGIMPDISKLTIADTAKLKELLDADSERERVLTEREKQRRAFKAMLK